MNPNPNDFEKAGKFYLGREKTTREDGLPGDLVLYDSSNLTTHAVVVGMTGSGKTGLCIDILEEAALDRIPAIVIDPKGDISNLLLTFPNLAPSDFEPWVEQGQADRAGVDLSTFAAAEAEKWKSGLAKWGQDGQRIQKLRDAVEIRVYTPGSTAGRPLTVLRSFDAPNQVTAKDPELVRDRIAATASGLLALLGIDIDPIRSREHILVSKVLEDAWGRGADLDLGILIAHIKNPPFKKVGVLDLDEFYPPKDRSALAMTLNNLLASPSFADWMAGDPLDIKSLLHTTNDKPCVSILSIAHLSDAERMFFATILLNEVLAWMRSQPGTSNLRAILYMDEIFGYFPPTRNPPSKTPMLTLLKQARAFGLGIILATQNPVDLDYKGLSNTGTWFLGRLQTERDKARVIEGLEGAAAQTGSTFDRRAMDKILAGLSNRVFLMNNVHATKPVVFETRWAMSYLRGPLTRQQLQTLCEPVRHGNVGKDGGPASLETANTDSKTVPIGSNPPIEVESPESAAFSDRPPVLGPSKTPTYFANPNTNSAPSERPVYFPGVYGKSRAHYVKSLGSGCEVDQWQELLWICPVDSQTNAESVWDRAVAHAADHRLSDQPISGSKFGSPPDFLEAIEIFDALRDQLANHIYRSRPLTIYFHKPLTDRSEPFQSRADFEQTVSARIAAKLDQELAGLRSSYENQLAALDKQIQASESTSSNNVWAKIGYGLWLALMFVLHLLWNLLIIAGNLLQNIVVDLARRAAKSRARSTVSLARGVTWPANWGQRKNGQSDRSRQSELAKLRSQKAELERKQETEQGSLRDRLKFDPNEVQEIQIPAKKSDIQIKEIGIIWLVENPDFRR